MQADAVPIKYRIAGKPLLSRSNYVGEIEQQTIRAMLPGGRQAASDLQGMDGKTDSDHLQQNQNEFHLRISLGKNIAGTARKPTA